MPNWCYNSVALHGDPKQLEKVYRYMEKALEDQPVKDADHPDRWIGQFIAAAGLDHRKYSCRGWIAQMDNEPDYKPGVDDCFRLDFESPYNPAMDAIDIAIRTALKDEEKPDVSYELRAEEPGEEVFINTDTDGVYFSDRYYLDFEYKDGVEETEEPGIHYFESLDELLSFLEDLTGYRPKDLEDAQSYECWDEEIIDYVSVHEYSSDWEIDPYSEHTSDKDEGDNE